MSPPAAGMALLLHAAVALALYLVSPLKFSEGESPPPIEVTIESPSQQTPTTPPTVPEPPKPAEAAAAQPLPPAPSSPAPSKPVAQPPSAGSNVPLGVPPPEPKSANKPSEATAKPAEPQQEAAPPPRPQLESVEKELPQVAAPPAPLSMQDFVRIAPPPPPQEIARPTPRPAPAPQRQQLQPSPLSSLAHPDAQQTPHNPSNTMVNPAEAAARNRAMDEYAWAVIRKFSQYLPNLRDKNEGGTVVLKFTIARDGRLLDVVVAQSSGVIALDRGMIDAIKAASPYPHLPADFPGDRATFTQPITAKR